MKQQHPDEIELASLSDGEARRGLEEHLRWCASCRRILTDYDWLQRELTGALNAEAAAAPVARPDWGSVRRRLREPRACQSDRRLVIATGVALIAFVMLVAPLLLGRGVPVQAMTIGGLSEAPAPVIAPASGGDGGAELGLTITPGNGERRVSLPFVPPPTPPEPEA